MKRLLMFFSFIFVFVCLLEFSSDNKFIYFSTNLKDPVNCLNLKYEFPIQKEFELIIAETKRNLEFKLEYLKTTSFLINENIKSLFNKMFNLKDTNLKIDPG